jgi:hypothetical protein
MGRLWPVNRAMRSSSRIEGDFQIPVGSSPIRKCQSGSYHFGDTYPRVLISRYFRIGGHSPGTRTVGVFLFGLINERIGGFCTHRECALIRIRRSAYELCAGRRTKDQASKVVLNRIVVGVKNLLQVFRIEYLPENLAQCAIAFGA